MANSQLDAHLVGIQSHGVGGEDHERECAVYNCLGALESSFFLKTLQSWFIMAIKRLRRLLRVNWHDFLLSHFFLDDLRTNLKASIELNYEIGLLAALIILIDKFWAYVKPLSKILHILFVNTNDVLNVSNGVQFTPL